MVFYADYVTPMAQHHLRAVAKATADVEKARAKWLDAIMAALDSGETLRDIAPHTGISYSRVHQLARDERRRREESQL